MDYVYNSKISNLKINTDDILLINAKTETGARLQFNLNYFSRKSIREIRIDGENLFIKADLINNSINMIIDDKEKYIQLNNNFPNKIYEDQHRAIISGDSSRACTFNEAMGTLDLIKKIREWPN